MADVDLNLLVALDALLAEGSVTGAARRLGLSSSAMSRTLTRLRSATGDPLLVRAGRGLVPTPYAAELSKRELQVLRLLDSDLSAPEIARELFVSYNTVRTHTKHIFTKLEVSTRPAAVRRARERGLM